MTNWPLFYSKSQPCLRRRPQSAPLRPEPRRRRRVRSLVAVDASSTDTSSRPKRTQERSFRLYVLRQWPAWHCPRGEPRYQLRYVLMISLCSKHTNNHAGQVGKLLGEKWKGLTDKQKAPYEAKAAQDKKRYEEEKANYQVNRTITHEMRQAINVMT